MMIMDLDASALLHEVASRHLPKWWADLRENDSFDYWTFIGLALAYTITGVVASVQLHRISKRVPQYGWTTQKVFHLLNIIVCFLRASVMFFRYKLETFHSMFLQLILNDLPGLLFFTTYTLLVLFWAEIYHQAKSQSTSRLRPAFLATNVLVYVIQLVLLLVSGASTESIKHDLRVVGAWFLVLVSLLAAAGFLIYGGRLVYTLYCFPLESRGRAKKMQEVGTVTAICAICFVVRASLTAMSTIDNKDCSLNTLNHPVLNIMFYGCFEILPSALVLIILRKLPPRQQPQPVYTGQDYASSGAEPPQIIVEPQRSYAARESSATTPLLYANRERQRDASKRSEGQ